MSSAPPFSKLPVETLKERLSLPVIGAPMFIVSGPELVIAQCKAGVVGSFPTLNARTVAELDAWLARFQNELGGKDAPFAANLIVHRSNARLAEDLALVVKYQVPLVITSLGAREDVNEAIHSYGGVVLHDVIHNAFAKKAIAKGADGLIAVAAGAGGHAGAQSPFALVQEIRAWFSGPLALSGAIANGASILAAEILGADFAYVGSAFIATDEANAVSGYKEMITTSSASDILYTDFFTGVLGNYLKPSILAAGYDPDNLPDRDRTMMDFSSEEHKTAKAWRDIWGAGQGVGAVREIAPTARLIARLKSEYDAARARVSVG